jgi:hypothetical protein
MGLYDDLVGELEPGQSGWLPLDDLGVPNGPATLSPPPPPGKACSVKRNDAESVDDGADELVSSAGAPLSPPLNNNVDRRVGYADEAPPPPPVITSISPSSAVSGDPTDIEMTVSGTGFNSDSVIVFNGLDEPTDYFSATSLGTGVKPSLFVVPAVCPVTVRNGSVSSNSVDFEFTAPASRRRGADVI